MDEDRERLLQIDGAMPRLNAIPTGCAFNPRCPQAFDRCRASGPTCCRPARHARRAGCTRRRCGPRHERRPTAAARRRSSRSHGPGQDLRRLAALAEPRGRAQAAPVRACGRRRQLRDPAAARRSRWSANRAAARAPWRACWSACTRRRAAASRFDGVDAPTLDARPARALRRRMQMIFQDPYASLNPRWKVRGHRRRAAARARPDDATSAARARRAARRRAAALGGARGRPTRRSFRTSSPAGSGSGSRSRARWRPSPSSSSATSRPRRSTSRCRRRCSTS